MLSLYLGAFIYGADFSDLQDGDISKRATDCTDETINDAFHLWFAKLSKQTWNIHSRTDIRKGYAAMLDSIIVENVERRAALFRKCKVPPKYFRDTFVSKEGIEDMNFFFVRDLSRLVQLKSDFYTKVVNVHHNMDREDELKITFYDWVKLGRDCGDSTDFSMADYAYRTNPKRIIGVDKRQPLTSDFLWQSLEMTSGYVPPIIDYSKIKGDDSVSGLPRPIRMKFSPTPDLDLVLERSKSMYEARQREKEETDSFIEEDYGNGIGFYGELRKRSRTDSTSSEGEEISKKMCLGSTTSVFRDERMIHTELCPDECTRFTDLEKCERLWFINNLKGAEFKNEFDWLDAEVRRFMSDEYHFEMCTWCGDPYSVLNFMRMAYSGSTPKGIIDKMLKFCSFHCFSERVAYQMQVGRYADLRDTEFDRVHCSACNTSTYEFTQPGNSWRCLDYFYGRQYHTGHSERLPVCSDECFIYLSNKINEKNHYKRSLFNRYLFACNTCLSCSKMLIPSEKICHLRNFPRLGWAFCCFNSSCIFKSLYLSMPLDPLKDSYFMSSSVPVPFDRLVPDRQAEVLKSFNVKMLSSASGGRFILTILE